MNILDKPRQIRYCFLYGNTARSFSSLANTEDLLIRKGDGFFAYHRITSLLAGRYEFVYEEKNPDVIVLWVSNPSKFGVPVLPYMFYKLATAARRIWGWRPVLISSCYEAVPLDLRNFDAMYSSEPPQPTNITCSSAADVLFAENSVWKTYRRRPKSKFCNFLYSAASFPDAPTRIGFCKLLMRYKHIDAPGKLLNNMPSIDTMPKIYATQKTWEAKLSFLKDYKFTIAFENRTSSVYVSEKIEHAFAVGSIPIYWGNPNITDYYNPAAFINCRDYANFDEVIERVIETDNNPKLYAEYMNAPRTLPGQHYHNLQDKILGHWEKIYAKIQGRRRDPRQRQLPGRISRLGWMFLRNLDYEYDCLFYLYIRKIWRKNRDKIKYRIKLFLLKSLNLASNS